jgi:hypothetical protein
MKKKYLILMLVLSGIPFASRLGAQDSLNINFIGMTPHVGQNLYLYLRDPDNMNNTDSLSVEPIDTANFTVSFESIVAGTSYLLDFWADMNMNGTYDVPPTDHAWRIALDSVEGDTTIAFVHNTDFTDITWEDPDTTMLYQVTLHLSQMGPHVGQNMTFYLEDAESDDALDSLVVSPVDSAQFIIIFGSLQGGMDYNLDFWADFNTNGTYDVPPVDHAWRIELLDVHSDTTLEFIHNASFTDIFGEGDSTSIDTTYQLTLNFTEMDSIDGDQFLIFLRDPETGEFIDSTSIAVVDTSNFTVVFENVYVNVDYNIDFYADLNGNGSYDLPPGDQAWRISLSNIQHDTTIVFVYSNNFTDIDIEDEVTGIGTIDKEAGFIAYPSPARNELYVNLKKSGTGLSVFNTAGALVLKRVLSPAERQVQLNVSSLKPGIYVLRLDSKSGASHQKFMKE